ncbi:MAG: hypothetical protein QM495_02255 [Lutibacter sp.]|uniref:hypothetical protein n=1 Tax=Lutibacter sp. TaxID=1925666 RepID=UPI00385B6624
MNYRLYKKTLLLFSILFLINHTLYSQDEDDIWVVGIGINAVDIRTADGFSGVFKDYANGSIEDLNMSGAFVRVFAGKYLKNGMSLQLSLSANKIEKGFNYSEGDPLLDDSFFAIDTKLKYDLNKLIGETSWFDPFVLAGAGYSKIGDISNFNLAAGWGFNVWFSRSVGVNFQSDYNHNPNSTATDYFQHSIGLVFKLNSSSRFKWKGR